MKAYVLMIKLRESDPLIYRRVVVPVNVTYKTLHDIIQNVTNFKSGYPYPGGYHGFYFELEKENIKISDNEELYQEYLGYLENKEKVEQQLKNVSSEDYESLKSRVDMFPLEIVKSDNMKIGEYLEKYKSVDYMYDYGDGWDFEIVLEDTIDNYYLGYPCLIGGENDAPPEDAGGMHGFYNKMEIVDDPDHPEYDFIIDWLESQEFERYDPLEINKRLNLITLKKTERKLIELAYIKSLSDS